MEVLLMSDTHGEYAITRHVLLQHSDVDCVCHMGDVGFDAGLLQRVVFVCGNHDQKKFPPTRQMNLHGYETLMIHGDYFEYALREEMARNDSLWRCWDACMEVLYNEIFRYAKDHGIELVLFGHTHTACFLQRDGITICNPGSLCFSHDGRNPSYAVLTLTDHITAEFYVLEEEGTMRFTKQSLI